MGRSQLLLSKLANDLSQRKKTLKKGIYYLPNIFSLGNGFFGYLSIIYAAQGDFIVAANLILLGAILDFLDGRAARLLGLTSEFGMQLDSFSDLISFCLAPSILIYFWQLNKLGVLGILASAVFLFAGVFRLARYNLTVTEQTIFFMGIPSTIAGTFLVTLLLNSGWFIPSRFFAILLFFIELLFAYLMVSGIKFPSFKVRGDREIKKKWGKTILIFLFALIAVMRFYAALLLLFLLYFSFTVLIYFKSNREVR